MTNRLPDEPLTTRQLAAHLGVCFRTVQRWVALKKIQPTVKTLGGHRRFSLQDANKIRRRMCPRPKPGTSHLDPQPAPIEPDIFA